mmetsp:Transcript_115612/g.334001  ORF Transcript_115612/g.334001 Transcript_115612/m.334001 type:complete len:287 (+) Transcript_115612:1134-1994(+)
MQKPLLQHGLDQGLHLRRAPVHRDLGVFGDALDLLQRPAVVGVEGALPCPHVKHHHADGEDVTSWRPETPVPHLRRHVPGRPAHAGPRAELIRETEVNHNHLRALPVHVAGDHHIRLLQVGVDNTIVVEELHPHQHLVHDIRHPTLVDRHTGLVCVLHSLRQVSAEVRLLHNVDIVPVLEDLEDTCDLRVLQGHQKLELPGDLLHGLFLIRLRIHLHDHLLAAALALRQHGDPLAAPAELPDDLVALGKGLGLDTAAQLRRRLRGVEGVAIVPQHAKDHPRGLLLV